MEDLSELGAGDIADVVHEANRVLFRYLRCIKGYHTIIRQYERQFEHHIFMLNVILTVTMYFLPHASPATMASAA